MDGKPEAEPEAGEFPEWELLHNSNPNEEPVDLAGIDSAAAALIRHDHFSLHPNVSVSNSSSGSSTDPAEVDRNFDDSYVANQLFPGGEMYVIKESPPSNLQIWNDSDSDSDAKTTAVAETTSGELLDGDGVGGFNSKEEEEERSVESTSEEKEKEKEEEEEEERRMVWWKVPFEVFKYWVARVSPVPVWSLSVAAAAAFVGLVILGRRLYKMKRKTQSLKLDIALDDKKVSQLMGRVARLNEAFSVVRRVPIVRPSLPASGVTLRPVMSMR